ncbi:PTS sugar transporter subunit IIB [Paenibacillus alkaliterrae]|uniref:PTS sugar transporter subunit IIB n=1 Tax=Paenibacillus alkaliterrae TaxID=320909 RepID=UPI001F2343D7|nr:PTS sugar transporter subunit IIB [Paenibacillus alkaliterrae]MCF2941623.1 PTS sugar transporter subunit IIB [Paenibacillus alkaliterrae]
MRKKVIFACATGVATSTFVSQRVMQYCEENGVPIDYEQSNVASLPSLDNTADLIVATTTVPYDLKTPVIYGMGIITGIDEDEVFHEIMKVIKEE